MTRPDQLRRLAPGEYYQYQLVGCRVEDLQGRSVGVVRGVWETGAPDVLVIEGDDGVEQLIPCAPEILREVDAEGRRIVIDAPPGLLVDTRGEPKSGSAR